MSNLKGEASVLENILIMSEGNPGVMVALTEVVQQSNMIDPCGLPFGLGVIVMLDELKIFGSRIYMLHNDVCHRNVAKMITLLRAYQLGQLAGVTKEALDFAIDNRGEGLDLEAAYASVKIELTDFDPSDKFHS